MTPALVIVAGDSSVGDAVTSGRAATTLPSVRAQRLGQAEVEHLDGAVRTHLDVGGLQVAVNDALLVSGFERLSDLARDRQRLVERQRALRDAIGKRGTFDELEHQRLP